MRRIARVFLVLFCLTFLYNKAVAQGSVLIHVAEAVNKLMMCSIKGFAFHVEVQADFRQRIEAMELYLAKVAAYEKPNLDRTELEKAGEEYKKALADYLDHVQIP